MAYFSSNIIDFLQLKYEEEEKNVFYEFKLVH